MPRKAKAFKSKAREAQKTYKQGKITEANKMYQEIAVDRKKLKAEKAEKRAAKKAAKKGG